MCNHSQLDRRLPRTRLEGAVLKLNIVCYTNKWHYLALPGGAYLAGKNRILKLAVFALGIQALAAQNASPIPRLLDQHGASQIIVDGHPFLVRGGELENSSAYQGRYLRMPSGDFTIRRVRLYTYSPDEQSS
jgi:hypothetical protein